MTESRTPETVTVIETMLKPLWKHYYRRALAAISNDRAVDYARLMTATDDVEKLVEAELILDPQVKDVDVEAERAILSMVWANEVLDDLKAEAASKKAPLAQGETDGQKWVVADV